MTTTPQMWLDGAEPPLDRVGAVERARALRDGSARLPALLAPPLGEDLEIALVGAADATRDGELVALLRDHAASKAARKEASRVAYRLKGKGVHVPEPSRASAGPVSLAVKPEPPPCYATIPNAVGTQFVLLGLWSLERGGPYGLLGTVDERVGLVEVRLLEGLGARRTAEVVAVLGRGTVVVPTEVAAGRLRWALDTARGLGHSITGEVGALARAVADAEPALSFEIQLDPEDEARIPSILAALAGKPPLFFMDMSDSDVFVAALHVAMHAEGERTAETLGAAYDSVVLEHLDRSFSPTVRTRLAQRMDLAAWLFAVSGEHEAALEYTAAARVLRDLALPPREALLIRQAFEQDMPKATFIERALSHDLSHGGDH